MKRYALLALTTFLTISTALPAAAGRQIWVDRTRREVIVRRCFNDRGLYNNPYYDPYSNYSTCRYVIKRAPNRSGYRRVYDPYRHRYYIQDRYDRYDRYRYRRPGVQIRIGY
jgi:hypothetical protein